MRRQNGRWKSPEPRNAVTSSSSNSWISLWTWLRTQSSNCSHSGLDSDLLSVVIYQVARVSRDRSVETIHEFRATGAMTCGPSLSAVFTRVERLSAIAADDPVGLLGQPDLRRQGAEPSERVTGRCQGRSMAPAGRRLIRRAGFTGTGAAGCPESRSGSGPDASRIGGWGKVARGLGRR